MEEGGIAHAGDEPFVLAETAEDLLGAVGHAESRAHADAGILGVERRGSAQGVTAYVAGQDHILQFGQLVEKTPMRAAGAENGGPGRGFGFHLDRFRPAAQEGLGHYGRGQFAAAGYFLLAEALDAGGPDLLFQVRFQFFNDVERLDLSGESLDLFQGQGEGEAELEIGGLLAENFPGVLISRAGGYDADFPVVPLDEVQGRFFGKLRQFQEALFQFHMEAAGHGRHQVETGLAFIRPFGRSDFPARLNHAFAVIDAGGGAQEDRALVFFGNHEGRPDHVLGFLAVGRLQHGHLGELGVIAVVLLVLGGVQAGVVGADQDQPPVDAAVGNAQKRVGGHVDPHVLHGRQGPAAGHGGPYGRFQGHLFVGRPFRHDFGLGASPQDFQDLGRGRAGVGAGIDHAGLERPQGYGFIAGKQFFHGLDRMVDFIRHRKKTPAPFSVRRRSD